ncbi:UNC93-like protein C922,05c [Talaromyces islandicus]|uniref:UNC93-like protein C922,05c n=1 Tax=Talaromyces islandicus TaxID=28573 RepID=A0A0U1M0R6_TALIS|nr:UNC93-like protein C922,05c [Talaromyces islandicus]
MYNALSGLGGSGQVDPTVAANATVALLSATAGTALFVAGPIFQCVGPRMCLILGGWTYALYSGSLLGFNHTENGAFVIASGAILGVGASFLWVSQGAIMTTYVPESQKGRAIAIFWIIFNLGGGVGSLASFGLNFHSNTGTVSDSTYIALLVIMVFGWASGLLICSPLDVKVKGLRTLSNEEPNQRQTVQLALRTMSDWRVLCMLPVFFSANVFYSYQQNEVNGMTFNIRTRSLNGALYWMAQMLGGLIMGCLLDMPWLTRRWRAVAGWVTLFVAGMAIWGGGYKFQLWSTHRLAQGLKQDIDYTNGSVSAGPIVLYVCYGAYDALWQSFCYWLIGAQSNSPAKTAILVGAYKTLQSTGGAMAWRVNALKKAAMTQFAMDWILCIGSLLVVIPTVWAITSTNVDEEDVDAETQEMGDVKQALPSGKNA